MFCYYFGKKNLTVGTLFYFFQLLLGGRGEAGPRVVARVKVGTVREGVPVKTETRVQVLISRKKNATQTSRAHVSKQANGTL